MAKVPHVVVVGAGFGGLATARALRGKPVRVTWIDSRNYHLFQPLLYQVATAALSPADIATPVREIARGCSNIEVVCAEVVGADPQTRVVRTRRQKFSYDYLVIATGSETSYFGNRQWARFASGLKTLEEAVAIRREILLTLENADMAETDAERQRLLMFVLIGAGPTGTEMAGAVADLAKHTLAGDFPHIDPGMISVILLEAMDQVLPGFPTPLAVFAQRKLERMGVDVRTGTMVEAIDDHAVSAAGERISASVIVWSAGVKATPVADWLAVEAADKKGRVAVRPDLSVPDRDGVFVIGDAALAKGEDGEPLPGLAAVAKQQGTFVGQRIVERVQGRDPTASFRYRDWGTLATMGRTSAVANFGRFTLCGFAAWVVWGLVHIWYLIAFRNRIRVLVNWIWQYARFSPGARLILHQDRSD